MICSTSRRCLIERSGLCLFRQWRLSPPCVIRRYPSLPFTGRSMAYSVAPLALLPLFLSGPLYCLPFGVAAALLSRGAHDLPQTRRSLLRHYPIVGDLPLRNPPRGARAPALRRTDSSSDRDLRKSRSLAFMRLKGRCGLRLRGVGRKSLPKREIFPCARKKYPVASMHFRKAG